MKTINYYLLKALFGVSILAMFLLSYSCSQETSMDGTENIEAYSAKSKKGAKTTRAMRGKINNDATTNPAIPPNEDCGFPLSANDIFGNMTHLGKIQPGSYGIPTSCSFGGPGILITTYEVNYIGAHGDEIRTLDNTTIICDDPNDPTCPTGTFEGTIEIIGGTGRFEGATGNMVFVDGSFIGSKSTWEVMGEITY
jgi:hypothetical protein